MSEMVERMARAHWNSNYARQGCGNDWDTAKALANDATFWNHAAWRDAIDIALTDARAAILAMSNPTEAMCSAADDCDGSTVYDVPACGETHWRAMIRAALSDRSKHPVAE